MKRYGAILADPPWEFETYSARGRTARAAEHHYVTAETAALMRLDVAGRAARDCALFMWVVDTHLDQGLALMQGWGFVFSTIAFVWIKTTADGRRPRMGMGKWTRKEAEICLLGTRGAPRRFDKGVRQVILEPRREHSRKPDCVYGRVARLVRGPYLEMFARQRWPGWDAWGNETGKFRSGVR